MSQNSIWGRRNPKIEGSHWEQLDLSSYKMTKPIVICLSGNATINEREANGFCKTAENLMGLKLSSKNPEEIYEYADLIGVSYSNREGSETGKLTNEDIESLVTNILMPLCVDESGQRLPIEEACKNVSTVTFFSFCHGAIETFNICREFNIKLIKELGLDGDETDLILQSMMEISYSPRTISCLTPRVSAYSAKDTKNAVFLQDYDFNNQDIVFKTIQQNHKQRVFFDSIDIYASKLSDYSRDEHGVNIIRRDENWQSMEESKNADCVSQMMGYALARSVANSINNFNSTTYIPKITMHQLLGEMDSIKQSFTNEEMIER